MVISTTRIDCVLENRSQETLDAKKALSGPFWVEYILPSIALQDNQKQVVCLLGKQLHNNAQLHSHFRLYRYKLLTF